MRTDRERSEWEKPLKKYKKRILLYALSAVIVAGAGGAAKHFSMYGKTVEETYRKYYNVSGNEEVDILHEENVLGWTAAIVREENKVVYCALEHRDGEERYRIRNAFQTDTAFLTARQKEKELKLSKKEAEAVDRVMAESEVKRTVNEFYLSNEAFREEKLPYVGVYCSPIIEGLEIRGHMAEIEAAEVSNEMFYIWKIEKADYKKVTEEDIKIIH